VVHLLAITIGFLIALALQAAVEGLHDRSLLRCVRRERPWPRKSERTRRALRSDSKHCQEKSENWKAFFVWRQTYSTRDQVNYAESLTGQ
jgi:hypothetical protein